MITVRLMNEFIKIQENSSLETVLQQKGFGKTGYAVIVNNQFIPMSLSMTTILNENDEIEIIIPMQGG
jgi:thiamine biosynthesis protein ThiS